ncbi:MAG: META domain-containing protein [Anaerolineales bacterium]
MKNNHTRRDLLFASMILILLGGCSLNLSNIADPLQGTSWTLKNYSGKDLIPGSEMTATFEDGKISGAASCNRYFASYITEGETLIIEGLAWTEMACLDPEGIMAQESEIMRMLGAAESYQIQGDQLVIQDAEAEKLIFAPQQAD